MSYVVRLAALMCFTVTLAGAQEDGYVEQGTIRLAASSPSAMTTLNVGDALQLRFAGSYRDLPTDVRLYVILTPLRGDAMLFSHDESLTASGGSLRNCANFRQADSSRFGFAPSNFPLAVGINVEQILDILMKGQPPEAIARQKRENAGRKLWLTFAFLASLPAGSGDASGAVGITVPDLGYHYDGLLATPYFFRFASDGTGCATFDSKRMNSVRYRVNSGRTPPEPKVAQQTQAVMPTGDASVVRYSANPMRVGAPAAITVRTRYADLGRGSMIYVLLNAMRGDTVVRMSALRTSAGSMRMTTCEEVGFRGGYFAIPAESKPLYASIPFLGEIEAALVAEVPNGGSGEVEGVVRFTPPPLSALYDGVRLIPVIFQWNDDGKRCAVLDTERMKPIVVRMTGR